MILVSRNTRAAEIVGESHQKVQKQNEGKQLPAANLYLLLSRCYMGTRRVLLHLRYRWQTSAIKTPMNDRAAKSAECRESKSAELHRKRKATVP